MQGNFVLNSEYLLTAMVSRMEASMKRMISLWVWNKAVVPQTEVYLKYISLIYC